MDLIWKVHAQQPHADERGARNGHAQRVLRLPVRDSIDDIFDSIKHTALIQKAGGGTGFAFDELRPTGDFIKSSGGSTSGPISFWRAFSEATNAIQQGAFRRGANMGMMYIHHPDILKFLHAKQDLDQFTNYNISVKVTDEWMEAFRAAPDSPHVVRNPRTGKEFTCRATSNLVLRHPHPGSGRGGGSRVLG
jgi:ribonucleoside-diphosphate reductase alpha chain